MSFRDRDPVVTPLDVKPNPSHPEFVIVSVRCPHCDGIHTHGARPGQDPGHRVSHCHGTGYFIRNTLTMPENQENTMQHFIDYEPNNVLVRFPCYICGGSTEKQDPIAVVRGEVDEPTLFVCDDCCAQTPERRSSILREQAHWLRMRADRAAEEAEAEWVLRTPQDQARSQCRTCDEPTKVASWVEDCDPMLTITGWVHVTDSTPEEDCGVITCTDCGNRSWVGKEGTACPICDTPIPAATS